MDIARRGLRDLQIQKAPAHGRLAPDDLQVAAVEQDGIDLPDHFRQPRVPDAVDPGGLFLRLGQRQLDLNVAVLVPDHIGLDTGLRLLEADQFGVFGGPRGFAGRQDVEAFQQVAFALRVAPDKDVQSRPGSMRRVP